ncbi:MAG TPA: GNAT family N-acetyltransferase [Rubricoccaceae bacterium]|nr:GNAT family N-acetyltransferase [Rubricoccaceae bacterium]
MGTTVEIRRARPSDREAVVALWRALHAEHEALDPTYRLAPEAARRWGNDFNEWVRSTADLLLVADAASEDLAGWLTAHLTWPPPIYAQRSLAYVDDVFVRRERRGEGVGRRLLEGAVAWARVSGAEELRAGVLAANPQARSFWQQVGARDLSVVVALPL